MYMPFSNFNNAAKTTQASPKFFYNYLCTQLSMVAQMAERATRDQKVLGSIPAYQYTKVFQCDTSTFIYTNKFNQYLIFFT